ncbi:metal-dependent hydrolase family protein [Sinosporangium siamense]|uniref:Hydrolase n=1 Tax=Sinosporangium siamense TaxID=1367973 RepID=A0A919VB02_9ACTN|nr:amidohydrolase family protein [Sinosporangium siamense]GII97036.1 hydrolase [Sinosporangium siamense]
MLNRTVAPFRIHNVRLIDGVNDVPIADAVVDVDADGWITYAGLAATSPARREGTTLIDGAGGTVLPGLFDCHTHLGFPSDRSLIEAALLIDPVLGTFQSAERLRRTLGAGITSVRDLGGLPSGYRAAVQAGLIPGPRIQTAVGVISHTGGHADGTLPGGRSLDLDYTLLADDVTGVRVAARRMLRAGADVLKICTSGGISSAHDDPDDEGLLDEEIAAVVDEGRRHRDRHVAAHAQGRAGILAAIRGGVRSVEHGFGIDDEGCDLLGEAGAFLVPTVSTAFQPLDSAKTPKWRYDKKVRWAERTKTNIAAAIARGVNIAVGTDSGMTPHGENATELWCLVELGMGPMDAIRAATFNSARLLGVDDRLGAVRPGYAADLIVCAEDPLKDIRALSRPDGITFVAQQGIIHKSTLPCDGVTGALTSPLSASQPS